jgi:uncharacterized OB-fold protein
MRVIAQGLFTDESSPRLVGGRHRESGRIVFPCPASADFEPQPLQRRGKLWSWTIQRYRPKSPPYVGPQSFTPWAVAYVELPGETIVEARLVEADFDKITIGMDLEMAPTPLDPAAPEPVLIPAFRPVRAAP